jgi:hypothetical protein
MSHEAFPSNRFTLASKQRRPELKFESEACAEQPPPRALFNSENISIQTPVEWLSGAKVRHQWAKVHGVGLCSAANKLGLTQINPRILPGMSQLYSSRRDRYGGDYGTCDPLNFKYREMFRSNWIESSAIKPRHAFRGE